MLCLIFSIIKEYAVYFAMFNLVGGMVLLIVGLGILKQKEIISKNMKMTGYSCVVLSALMFIGTFSNILFSHIL